MDQEIRPGLSVPKPTPPDPGPILSAGPERRGGAVNLCFGATIPTISVTYLPTIGEWELLAEVVVHEHTTHREITIPAGFRFDLASVPRPLWSIVAPFELSIAAPLIHDWLYQGGDRRYSRLQADRIFREIMEREGIVWWRREAAYLAVRRYGAEHWRG